MTLKPREQKIVWTTLVVLVLGMLWMIGIQPVWDGYQQTQELLETEEKEYDDNREILKDSVKIEREFNRIKSAIPREATDERSAKDAFSEDVNQDATKMLGARPQVGIVERKELKDVPGFSFLVFPITANGNLKAISDLLKAFDQRGYLINQVTITQKNIDNPELKLDLQLARIVQIEEPKPEKKGSPFGGFGSKSGSGVSR